MDRTLRAIGRYAEARNLAQDTLDRDRRILGEDHPDTLISVASRSRTGALVMGAAPSRCDWVRPKLAAIKVSGCHLILVTCVVV